MAQKRATAGTKTKAAASEDAAWVKISANLPAETVDLLKSIAAKRRTTMTEALRRAIEMESFVVQTIEDDGKLLIEDTDKNVKQVLVR